MCGIYGCIGDSDSVSVVIDGLHRLQYRGDDSAGVVAWNGNKKQGERLVHEGGKRIGTVDHLRRKLQSSLFKFTGSAAIGHTRYATLGGGGICNAQPFVRDIGTKIAIAHNGDLERISFQGQEYTIDEMRKLFLETVAFDSTSDTEVALHLLARTKDGTLINRIIQTLKSITGAYSFLFLTEDGYLIAARDPWGFRPLWIGKDDHGALHFSSEDYVFDQLQYSLQKKRRVWRERELERGEILVISPDLEVSSHYLPKMASSFCAFEFVYFAFPASTFCGLGVSELRIKVGWQHAFELIETRQMPELDIIVPVPDSSLDAISGFHECCIEHGLKIPIRFGLLRDHYVRRVFITAGQENRVKSVNLKYIVDSNLVRGKRVGLVDDSIVRSTTIRMIIQKVRAAGAREVHVFIPCPPIIGTCPSGIDMKTPQELIAAQKDVPTISGVIGANSLHYLSLDGFRKCFGDHRNFCMGCFSREYPTARI